MAPNAHHWHQLIEHQMVQDHLARLRIELSAQWEELRLLHDEARWRSKASPRQLHSLAPALAACHRQIAALRAELREIRTLRL